MITFTQFLENQIIRTEDILSAIDKAQRFISLAQQEELSQIQNKLIELKATIDSKLTTAPTLEK